MKGFTLLLLFFLALVVAKNDEFLPDGHVEVDLTKLKESGPLDPNKIICPVLAAMVRAGDLHPDSEGSCTLEDIKNGLHYRIGCNKILAAEQAIGIADYDEEYKESMTHRDRCLPGTQCWADKQANGVTNLTERWLNIYKMDGLETVEHGFSTGVRGGAGNVPDFDYTNGPCNGTYPCHDRLKKFYLSCMNDDGLFYLSDILCVICNAQKMGDRSGEFSYNPLQAGRQWQMTAAMVGWLQAFGRLDKTSEKSKLESEMDENGDVWYFTEQDVKDMLMEGKYPQGWYKRPWGNPASLVYNGIRTLPCSSTEPWWQDSDCPSFTGQTCIPGVIKCKGGAHCLDNGNCVCGKDDHLVSMCAKNGECIKRNDNCTYFGEKCKDLRIAADSPSAPF